MLAKARMNTLPTPWPEWDGRMTTSVEHVVDARYSPVGVAAERDQLPRRSREVTTIAVAEAHSNLKSHLPPPTRALRQDHLNSIRVPTLPLRSLLR